MAFKLSGILANENPADLAASCRKAGGVRWLADRAEAAQVFEFMLPLAEVMETSVREHGGAHGYCRGCQRWQWFRQPQTAPGDWANTLEGLLCECGMNGRMRGILASVDSLLATDPALANAAILERVTPLFPLMQLRIGSLTGSEYLGHQYTPGQMVASTMGQTVRHESMLDLSFPDRSLDLIMHFDVLEHVPDPALALRECHRVLRPGGWLLFSTPFYEQLEGSIVRAKLRDGELIHELEPCYHGNPVDGSGALVFTQFGWDFLPVIRDAGFPDAGILFCFNPVEGVLSDGCPFPDGHAWPVVFAARKL